MFAAFNAAACTWALVALVGVRNSLVDIAIGIRERLYKSEKPVRYKRRRTPLDDAAVAADWRDVLYNGALADGRSRIDVKGADDLCPTRVELDRSSADVSAEALARAIAMMLDGDTDGAEVRVRCDNGDVLVTIDGVTQLDP